MNPSWADLPTLGTMASTMPMVAVSCTDRLLSMSRDTDPRRLDSHSKQVSCHVWVSVDVGALTLVF